MIVEARAQAPLISRTDRAGGNIACLYAQNDLLLQVRECIGPINVAIFLGSIPDQEVCI